VFILHKSVSMSSMELPHSAFAGENKINIMRGSKS
jgi:hypothetical protein